MLTKYEADPSAPVCTKTPGELSLAFKQLTYALRRNISGFYAVLFIQGVFAFVADIFLNSRRDTSLLNAGGSEFMALFSAATRQNLLTYSLLVIFITAATLCNREERSACYSMPCTPRVAAWSQGLFLLIHTAFTAFFAIVHFQAQRAVAYVAYGAENIIDVNFFYSPAQLLELGASLFFFGILLAGVGYLVGALCYLKIKWVCAIGAALAVLVVGMIFSRALAGLVLEAVRAMAGFYFNERSIALFAVKCTGAALAAFALALPVINRGEVKRV